MSWYSKEQATAFDNVPIEGLEFLSGDVLAVQFRQEWLKGKKYPLVQFPSGLACELIDQPQGRAGHLFGGLAIEQLTNRDDAYLRALGAAEEYGYQLARQGEDQLIALNQYSGRGYRVRYGNRNEHIADMTHFPQDTMQLLPGEIRAVMPPLYSNEVQGMAAIAPVKFFTPDSSWTWYASEFDGGEMFFDLVSGWDIELGYFSLTELEIGRGRLGLPVERDLWHEPQSLGELKALQVRLKG